MYCFGNEAWSSNSKEVSFNVHGVVYVPSEEIPSDPLEVEGGSLVSWTILYPMSMTDFSRQYAVSQKVWSRLGMSNRISFSESEYIGTLLRVQMRE